MIRGPYRASCEVIRGFRTGVVCGPGQYFLRVGKRLLVVMIENRRPAEHSKLLVLLRQCPQNYGPGRSVRNPPPENSCILAIISGDYAKVISTVISCPSLRGSPENFGWLVRVWLVLFEPGAWQ